MTEIEANRAPPFARTLQAAGVLFFDRAGRVLTVKPGYKPKWDIPGGYVERCESPRQAAAREVREELGLHVTPGLLLAVDWAPCGDDDKVLYVFEGGELNEDDAAAVVLGPELRTWRFREVDALHHYMPARLARRVRAAVDNRQAASGTYLEFGVSPARSATARVSGPRRRSRPEASRSGQAKGVNPATLYALGDDGLGGGPGRKQARPRLR